MGRYLIGTDVLVDCVARGRRFARGERVAGDVPPLIPLDQNATYSDSGTVLAVQQQLLARGITDEKGKPLVPDGVMGTHTAAAIKKMQGLIGAPQTGVIDSTVLMALKVTPSASPTTWTPQPTPAAPAPDLPSDGRPAKGWSQPMPNAMGPAITPESQGMSGGMSGGKIALIIGLVVGAVAAAGTGIVLATRGRHSS